MKNRRAPELQVLGIKTGVLGEGLHSFPFIEPNFAYDHLTLIY
jgi:hypothetical protein